MATTQASSLHARIDTSHKDMIHDAQMDFYGTRLATCSSDRTIKIFEVTPNGQFYSLAELTGHSGPVWHLAWSHPSFESILTSCGYDHKVILWKEAAGNKWQKLIEFSDHEASVNCVEWAPYQYGALLACASTDKNISLLHQTADGNWEVLQRLLNAHEQGCNCVSWCPSLDVCSMLPQAAATPQTIKVHPRRLVSAGNDNVVKIWRETNGIWDVESKLEGHMDWIRSVAWSPVMGYPTSVIASGGQDKRVIIWRCEDISEEKPIWTSIFLHPFDDVVWHLSWSLCGTLLAVSSGDNKVAIWKENVEGQWYQVSDQQK